MKDCCWPTACPAAYTTVKDWVLCRPISAGLHKQKYSLGTSTIQYINTQDLLHGRTNPPSLFQYCNNLHSSFYSVGCWSSFLYCSKAFISLNFVYWLLVLFPTLLEISFRKSLPMLINWSICLFFPSSFRVSGLTLSLIHFELCAEWKQRILYMWLSVFLTSVVEMLFFFLQCILLASLDIFLRHKLSSTEGNGL